MILNDIHFGFAFALANEKDTCAQFVRALLAQCDAFPFRQVSFFVVVDRVSKDRTRQFLDEVAASDPRLHVVWAPENRCVVDAYVRGYREALAAGCHWILEIDGGMSHDPADAPRFFETMARGYDCVFGTRLAHGGKFQAASLKRNIISRRGSFLTNLLLGTKLSDMTSGYELFTREALQMALDKGIKSRAHFFQTEIKVHCRNLKCAEAPISYSHPSPHLSNAAVGEAFARLGSLFQQRLSGTL